jgi:hypothetical protein
MWLETNPKLKYFVMVLCLSIFLSNYKSFSILFIQLLIVKIYTKPKINATVQYK